MDYAAQEKNFIPSRRGFFRQHSFSVEIFHDLLGGKLSFGSLK